MDILILHNGITAHNFPTIKSLINFNNKISYQLSSKVNADFGAANLLSIIKS
jgi:hypothetical protein